MKEKIQEIINNLLPETQDFLCDIMKYPSTSGQEHELMRFLAQAFDEMGLEVKKVPMSDEIVNDPDYCDPVPAIKYDGRFNLSISKNGTAQGRKLLFNAHTDVVPPSEGMLNPWEPRIDGGDIYGRGACDDKGQVALFYLVMKALNELGIELSGTVTGHLVNEEENGGNGSLVMTRAGETADACIVLEPTEGRLLTSIRGAVWFKILFKGIAGHSGSAGQTKSALLMARDAIGVLEKYHAELLESSRGFELFDPYPNPMPITFGKLQAGNWPAAAPSKATLEGVLGFLPNKTKEDICREMKNALLNGDIGLTEDDFELTFMYRHDCSVLEPGHELPQMLMENAKKAEIPLSIDAMTASCDAWFYNNQLKIPTLVFGAGTLKVAHSKSEHINIGKIAKAAELLINFILEYCR
jgi:acetylornithine deacetylase